MGQGSEESVTLPDNGLSKPRINMARDIVDRYHGAPKIRPQEGEKGNNRYSTLIGSKKRT